MWHEWLSVGAEDRWRNFSRKDRNRVIANTKIGKVWAVPALASGLGEVAAGDWATTEITFQVAGNTRCVSKMPASQPPVGSKDYSSLCHHWLIFQSLSNNFCRPFFPFETLLPQRPRHHKLTISSFNLKPGLLVTTRDQASLAFSLNYCNGLLTII